MRSIDDLLALLPAASPVRAALQALWGEAVERAEEDRAVLQAQADNAVALQEECLAQVAAVRERLALVESALELRDLRAADAARQEARVGLLHVLEARVYDQWAREPAAPPPRPRAAPGPRVQRDAEDGLPTATLQDRARLVALRAGWDAARFDGDGATKLRTVAERAAAANLCPAWLAFGEEPRDGRGPADWQGMGGRLKRRRQELGLGQRGLVAASGVSGGMISTLESGTRTPSGALICASVDLTEQLAAALGVPPGWLAFGDDAQAGTPGA